MLENSQVHQHWWLCDVAQRRCKRVGPLLAAVYEIIYDNFFVDDYDSTGVAIPCISSCY